MLQLLLVLRQRKVVIHFQNFCREADCLFSLWRKRGATREHHLTLLYIFLLSSEDSGAAQTYTQTTEASPSYIPILYQHLHPFLSLTNPFRPFIWYPHFVFLKKGKSMSSVLLLLSRYPEQFTPFPHPQLSDVPS